MDKMDTISVFSVHITKEHHIRQDKLFNMVAIHNCSHLHVTPTGIRRQYNT